MSVVVIGMEMPKTCNDCFICCEHSMLYKAIDYKRSPKCPLRPLPEKHGDLVDRQAMKYEAIRSSGLTFIGDGWSNAEVLNLINRQETIIEAEGGGDE